MEAHPIIDSPRRWTITLLLAFLAAGVQAVLLITYADAGSLPALADGMVSVGIFCVLAYLSWFVTGYVSVIQTELIVSVLALLFWLAGGFAVQGWIEAWSGAVYAPFVDTLPFRALFGVLCWSVVMLWCKLYVCRLSGEEEKGTVEEVPLYQLTDEKKQPVEEIATWLPEEHIDRITVKDGSRIHLIAIEHLLYVQACGDYVTLVTPDGQYIKELTMKYLETHLPASGFVRIHRSTIVNVTQISRVELFGKENYRLLLKNGDKLRVSLSGYKLLKARLEL